MIFIAIIVAWLITLFVTTLWLLEKSARALIERPEGKSDVKGGRNEQ